MALNLSKGQSLDLSGVLKSAGVGLGWQANENPNGPIFDLDVSAVLLQANGKIYDENYLVFYNSELTQDYPEGKRPYSGDGSVVGAVDETEGDDDGHGGDVEDMMIYFDQVWEGVTEIMIAVTISKYPHDEKKDQRTSHLYFDQVEGCYIRVWNLETGAEIFRYNLADQGRVDFVEFGRFKRTSAGWVFEAQTQGHIGHIEKLVELYT